MPSRSEGILIKTEPQPCQRFHVLLPPRDLAGDLRVPNKADALVIFAHGSGSSRLSPRNIEVAEALNEYGLATLLFDLLTETEAGNRTNVFDISLLADRLVQAVLWVRQQLLVGGLPLGLFGASTGAAAALMAADRLQHEVGAVVSRGGRPDLAGDTLARVTAPTLLIVGGADHEVIQLNQRALTLLRCVRHLAIIPGATHLFSEPGTLQAVVDHASQWFIRHLVRHRAMPAQEK